MILTFLPLAIFNFKIFFTGSYLVHLILKFENNKQINCSSKFAYLMKLCKSSIILNIIIFYKMNQNAPYEKLYSGFQKHVYLPNTWMVIFNLPSKILGKNEKYLKNFGYIHTSILIIIRYSGIFFRPALAISSNK